MDDYFICLNMVQQNNYKRAINPRTIYQYFLHQITVLTTSYSLATGVWITLHVYMCVLHFVAGGETRFVIETNGDI